MGISEERALLSTNKQTNKLSLSLSDLEAGALLEQASAEFLSTPPCLPITGSQGPQTKRLPVNLAVKALEYSNSELGEPGPTHNHDAAAFVRTAPPRDAIHEGGM